MMDKNMIHIDDLVRSRLQGGEEKERGGAWSSMRDMLDKEMPSVVAGGAGNRRLYGLLLLLLLGTSLTVGGYQWSLRNADKSDNTSGNSGIVLASATNSNPVPAISSRRAEAESEINLLIKNGASLNTPGKSSITQSLFSSQNSRVENADNDVQTSQNSSQIITGSKDKSDYIAPATAIQKASVSRKTEQSASDLIMTADGYGKSIVTANNTRQQAFNGATPALETVNVVPQNNLTNQVITPDGLHLLLRRDSMQRIDIAVHRMPVSDGAMSTPATLHYDTISMQMIAVYQPMQPAVVAINNTAPVISSRRGHNNAQARRSAAPTPVAANNYAAFATKATVTAPATAVPAPQAAPTSSTTEAAAGSNLVSLSSFKVSSVKHNWWNPEKFSNMVNKTKFKLAGIQMFGGIEAGINASFGNGASLGGFECGITGLIALNEMLSINTGLYFYQRYNTGATVHDNYVAVDPNTIHYGPVPIGGVIYNHYQWEEDSVDHHYNYEKIQTLELPVLLRYGAGRFFGEAGLNMMYAFKMKTDEITIHADHNTLQQASYPTSATPAFGTQPTVKPEDFNSRFGLGFAVGGGYHFSPAVTLDLHISKTIWDNAKTDGSRRISSDLYRIPSMQLSVGYRFSQQKASRPGGGDQ